MENWWMSCHKVCTSRYCSRFKAGFSYAHTKIGKSWPAKGTKTSPETINLIECYKYFALIDWSSIVFLLWTVTRRASTMKLRFFYLFAWGSPGTRGVFWAGITRWKPSSMATPKRKIFDNYCDQRCMNRHQKIFFCHSPRENENIIYWTMFFWLIGRDFLCPFVYTFPHCSCTFW